MRCIAYLRTAGVLANAAKRLAQEARGAKEVTATKENNNAVR